MSETVRRQLTRSFGRHPAKEEAVIRERFPIYIGLGARKVETMRPPDEVADALLTMMKSYWPAFFCARSKRDVST